MGRRGASGRNQRLISRTTVYYGLENTWEGTGKQKLYEEVVGGEELFGKKDKQ